MPSTMPRTVRIEHGRQVGAGRERVDLVGNRSKAFAQRTDIDVQHPPDLVVHFGRRLEAG